MLSVRMRLVLLVIFGCVTAINAASIKKSINEPLLKPEDPVKPTKSKISSTIPKPSRQAIVAIEIIDGPENNSSKPSKTNSKRTIESSLGYGYQSPFGPEPPKKFVIYKYSQHDIPGVSYNQFSDGGYNSQPHIQKGLGYHLGSTATHVQQQPSVEIKPSKTVYQASIPSTANQYHQPQTTLYTTLSNQGQVGSLSNHVPYQNVDHNGMVPVIILRVYSNQLTSPNTALHTNLPQSHPYSSLNNINLQSLLQNYVQQYLQSQPQYYHQMQDYQQLYQAGGHQAYQQAGAHQAYQQAAYTTPNEYHSNLPTSENYPSNLHTRVIFHSNNNGHIPEVPKVMYKTPGLSTYNTIPISAYKAQAPQPTYSEPDYTYSSGSQNAEQDYTYVYPNQVNQDTEYQQQEQTHQEDAVEQTEEPDAVDPPFNYHAHPAGPARKQRSKKNSIEVASTLPPKRREPRS